MSFRRAMYVLIPNHRIKASSTTPHPWLARQVAGGLFRAEIYCTRRTSLYPLQGRVFQTKGASCATEQQEKRKHRLHHETLEEAGGLAVFAPITGLPEIRNGLMETGKKDILLRPLLRNRKRTFNSQGRRPITARMNG